MSGMDRNITVYLVNPAASETISQVSDDSIIVLTFTQQLQTMILT